MMLAMSRNMGCSAPGNLLDPLLMPDEAPRAACMRSTVYKQLVAHLATGGDSGPQAGASEGTHQSGGHGVQVQRKLDCARRGK